MYCYKNRTFNVLGVFKGGEFKKSIKNAIQGMLDTLFGDFDIFTPKNE
jgi:hypothetical protein